jgi:hypothetical protein
MIELNELEQGLYSGQMEEFMDPRNAMPKRPDGHPRRYGHWQNEKRSIFDDMLLHILSD